MGNHTLCNDLYIIILHNYTRVLKNFEFKRGSRDCKETSSQQKSYHSPPSIVYCMCLLKYIQLQLGSYVHACTNYTFSSTSTRFNPSFVQNHAAKVGIKSCRGARECVICAYMYVATQLQLYILE